MKIKLFIFKLLLFCTPFLFLVFIYFYLDPFKVIRHYNHYYISGKPSYINLNKDFVSTENWINHYEQYKYDSYIFGNSRSMYYEIDAWKSYIHSNPQRCYHFDASGESLYGIAKKFEFLSNQKTRIKNAFIVLDYDILHQTNNSKGHIFLKDPNLSGQNIGSFQVKCLQSFFDFNFLKAFLDFKLSGKVKEYMKKDFLLDDTPFDYDYITNEVRQDHSEEIIKKNPEEYYGPRKAIFYDRDTVEKISERVIIKEQIQLLKTIKTILDKNQTNYKIVISPLYNQIKLNPEDVQFLKNAFGSKNVFDFSGINYFTKTKYNYYETSHYRSRVAAAIMKIVYAKN